MDAIGGATILTAEFGLPSAMSAELDWFFSRGYVLVGALVLNLVAARITSRRLSRCPLDASPPPEHAWQARRPGRNAAQLAKAWLRFLVIASVLLFVCSAACYALPPAAWHVVPLGLFYTLSLVVVSVPIAHAVLNAGNLRFTLHNRRKPDVVSCERAGNFQGLIEAVWFTEYVVAEMTLLRTRWVVDGETYMTAVESLLRMGRLPDLLAALQGRQDWGRYAVVLRRAWTYRGPGLFKGLYTALKVPNAELSTEALNILGLRAGQELQDYYELETLERVLGNRANWVVCAAARLLLRTSDPRAIGILERHLTRLISILDDEGYEAPDLVEILGEIGDSRAIEPMVRLLHSNLKRRRVLAQSLLKLGWVPANDEEGAVYFVQNGMWDRCVQIGGPAITPLLQAIEGGWVYGELEHILDTLVRIGDPKAADTLKKRLRKEENDGVLTLVADAIRRLGPHGIDVLLASIPNGARVARAIVAVMTPHTMECVPALILALSSLRGYHELVVALLASAGEAALEPLVVAMSGPDADVRKSATIALGKIAHPRSLDPLLSALEDCDVGLREVVIEALRRIGPPVDPDRQARYCLSLGDWENASRLGPHAVGPLISALKSSAAEIRLKAATTLGVIRDPRAVAPLIEARLSATRDAPFRAACVEALRQLPPPVDPSLLAFYHVALKEWEQATKLGATAIEAVVLALADPDTGVRRAAARALGIIGDQRALTSLRLALQDTDIEVRSEAALTLGKTGDAEAMKQLLALCSERMGRSVTESEVKLLNEIMLVLEKGGRADLREGIADLVFKHPDGFSRVNVPHVFGILSEKLQAIGLAFRPFETSRRVGWRDNDGYEVWLGYDTAPLESAVGYLCSVNNPVTVNLLHRLASFEGARVPRGYSDKGDPGEVDPTSTLGIQQKARNELLRRGNPPYNPQAYSVDEYFR